MTYNRTCNSKTVYNHDLIFDYPVELHTGRHCNTCVTRLDLSTTPSNSNTRCPRLHPTWSGKLDSMEQNCQKPQLIWERGCTFNQVICLTCEHCHLCCRRGDWNSGLQKLQYSQGKGVDAVNKRPSFVAGHKKRNVACNGKLRHRDERQRWRRELKVTWTKWISAQHSKMMKEVKSTFKDASQSSYFKRSNAPTTMINMIKQTQRKWTDLVVHLESQGWRCKVKFEPSW